MVNLELYRIFKIVADEENLTKASDILHISQPAVTKHIKNLENELDVKLFRRSKHGMILTEEGKKLYLQIKDSINNLINSDALFNENKDINLGIHINMPSNIYSDGISKYYEKNKNSTVNILKLIAKNMFSMLENQELDIVFSKKYSEEIYNSNIIKFINLGYLHDVFIVNSNSKYLKNNLSKEELKQLPIYTLKKFSSAYQNLVSSLDYKQNENINIKNVTFSGILELLKTKDIIAVVTEEYIKSELAKNELCILDTDITLEPAEYGIYYNINNKSQKINSFISIFKNESKI